MNVNKKNIKFEQFRAFLLLKYIDKIELCVECRIKMT